MQPEFLQRLKSGDAILGWADLCAQPEAALGLSRDDREQLVAVMRDEERDLVWRHAVKAMLCAGSRECRDWVPTALTRSVPAGQPPTLDGWWLSLFDDRPSCLLRVADRKFVRDEEALAQVARRFPYERFPQLEIRSVSLGDNRWRQVLLAGDFRAALVLGRLSLLGENADQRLASGNLRFSFPNMKRPLGLRRGQLDSKYHAILERTADGSVKRHQTTEANNIRTDFGLVQIYQTYIGTGWIQLVLCAGASSLGTLAAAYWLARHLPAQHGAVDQSPIPKPSHANVNSCMEVLLRVTADATVQPWQPRSIDLLRLCFDHLEWNAGESKWDNMRPHEITVVHRNDEPMELQIDGKKARLDLGSQNYRLAIGLTLAIYNNPDHIVSTDDLANDVRIWGAKPCSAQKVKRLLHNLKSRVFQDLLIVDDVLRLKANVTLVTNDESQLDAVVVPSHVPDCSPRGRGKKAKRGKPAKPR